MQDFAQWRRASPFELSSFVAVATQRSFRGAAAELGMSASALSHSIAALEQRIGVRLFHRTTRSVALSDAGERFLARVRPALLEIGEAMEDAAELRTTPTGTLRINTSEGAARRILAPVVLPYLKRYPDMKVELVTEGRLVDIVAGGFDAGVRLTEAVPQDMIAVPCSPPLSYAVVGSPRYFAKRKMPRVPDDLRKHACIRRRLASGGIFRWEFEKHGQEMTVEVDGPLTLDNDALLLEASLAGAGLVWMSEWAVADAIAKRRLVRVLEDWTPAYPGLSLFYPSHRRVAASLRAFIEVVREANAPTG